MVGYLTASQIVVVCLVASLKLSIGRDSAIIEIVLYENNDVEGGYTTFNHKISGQFTGVGATTGAEGDITQVPRGFTCGSKSHDSIVFGKNYGWVAYIKLPRPEKVRRKPCVPLAQKAQEVIQRGATAIIFDVSNNPRRAAELSTSKPSLFRPVLTVSGADAQRMSELVKWNGYLARARIHHKISPSTMKTTANEYFDMGIFMAFFILVSLICIGMLLKIKYRQRKKQTSLTRMALQAIARMETRKYTSSLHAPSSRCSSREGTDGVYSCTRWPTFDIRSCAICLEEFTEGQDIRIVPCRHEFHKSCVDPWLLTNCTCPLCLLNIVEPYVERKHSVNSTRWSRFGRRIRTFIPVMCRRQNVRYSTTNIRNVQPNIEELRSAMSISSFQASEADTTSRELPTLYSQKDLTRPSSVEPLRLHFCRNHRKKLSKDLTRSARSPSVSDTEGEIDHTIVVVANFPTERFDELQEDVV